MKLKILFYLTTCLIYIQAISQNDSYYHYRYQRKLKQLSSDIIISDIMECYSKNGEGSNQIIFIKDSTRAMAWMFVSDTVFFYQNKIWKFVPEKYDKFYLKSSQMLFPPLLNNGISYKKFLNDSNMNIRYTDSVLEGKKYRCLMETSKTKKDGMDSISITEYFYKGIPVKHRSFYLIKPSTQIHEVEILDIDSHNKQIKPILDSVLNYLRQNAIQWTPEENKKKTAPADTLKLIEDFVKSEGLSSSEKTIVIDLWYRGCGPCLQSIPSLNKLLQEENVYIIGLNWSDANEVETRKFMEKYEVKYRLKFDMNSNLRKLNIGAYPTVIFYNPLNKKFKFDIGFNRIDNYAVLQKCVEEVH